MLCSHTLQAIHMMVFVHGALLPLIDHVESAAVATGFTTPVPRQTLGNKGGIGIGFCLGKTSLLFINCHLAAGQKATDERDAHAHRIETDMRLPAAASGRAHARGDALQPGHENAEGVTERYDRVFWFGDMNYRVGASRADVDDALAAGDLGALLAKDQLRERMALGHVFHGFEEVEITFPPTYKLDAGTLVYDTGPKQRVPSWTDRVLYRPQGVEPLAYNCCRDYVTSDHLAVYGLFYADVDVGGAADPKAAGAGGRAGHSEKSKSQVCSIM